MKDTKRELMERLWAMEKANPTIKINFPNDVLPILQKYANRKQEHFIMVSLDGSHSIIKTRVITKGILNRTIIHPREIFRPAIMDSAMSIILCHNHPSGKPKPSKEDQEITKRLKDAGKIIGINVIDHIIISKTGYYSFLEEDTL